MKDRGHEQVPLVCMGNILVWNHQSYNIARDDKMVVAIRQSAISWIK
jgi:hypothetical protein